MDKDLLFDLAGFSGDFLLLFSQVVLVGVPGVFPVSLDRMLVALTILAVLVILLHHWFYVDTYHGIVSYHCGSCGMLKSIFQ